MPFIRSLASEYHTCIITLILLLSVIMPIYSYYIKKKLVCVVIIAPSNYQPSSYSKYIELNMRFSYNIRSVSNTECIFFIYL